MSGAFEDDSYCFVCGLANPWGLRLAPVGQEGRGSIRFSPERKHQGFAGVLHGGLVSTLFDETMAYAAMSLGGRFVTAEIRVRFRSPVSTLLDVEVSALVVERRGRLVRLKASLSQDGEEKATADGTFVQIGGGAVGD
jgi:acyl-coenzyme A thioesterase PaaI-like protein